MESKACVALLSRICRERPREFVGLIHDLPINFLNEHQEMVVDLLRVAVEIQMQEENAVDLVDTYTWIGEKLSHLDRFSEAIDYYEKALLTAKNNKAPRETRFDFRSICMFYASNLEKNQFSRHADRMFREALAWSVSKDLADGVLWDVLKTYAIFLKRAGRTTEMHLMESLAETVRSKANNCVLSALKVFLGVKQPRRRKAETALCVAG